MVPEGKERGEGGECLKQILLLEEERGGRSAFKITGKRGKERTGEREERGGNAGKRESEMKFGRQD